MQKIDLSNLVAGQAVQGVVLCKEYDVRLTKTGKEYISGVLFGDRSIGFKAWGNSNAFSKLKSENYLEMPVMVTGTVDDYQGTFSIVVNDVVAVEGYEPKDFLPVVYDCDAYFNALRQLVQSTCSEKGVSIANEVLFENSEVVERFKTEFAAKSHHDNCLNGLLAHTYKVVALATTMLNIYKLPRVDTDLIILGGLFHDIGKIRELNFGSYTDISMVTHNYLGAEIISKFKDKIIATYSEKWYYDLISIMLQHHGEFGENCRTVASYIIHQVDLLDAKITLTKQKLEENSEITTLNIDGLYLSV